MDPRAADDLVITILSRIGSASAYQIWLYQCGENLLTEPAIVFSIFRLLHRKQICSCGISEGRPVYQICRAA